MATIFYFLCFLSFLGIILSLAYPKLFTFVLRKHATRGTALAVFYGLFILFQGIYNDLSTKTDIVIDFIAGGVIYGLSVGIYIGVAFIVKKVTHHVRKNSKISK
jgi:hypothetical protein